MAVIDVKADIGGVVWKIEVAVGSVVAVSVAEGVTVIVPVTVAVSVMLTVGVTAALIATSTLSGQTPSRRISSG